MLLKELARTGVLIPEIGMGTSGYCAGPGALRKGLEAGALFVDTAESYGTEPVVGEALVGLRDRVFIATKVSPQNFSDADLRKSVDSSLQRLGVDTIDLLQLHRPNPSIPIEETMGAMADLIVAGKIRFVGVSNFSVTELREAQKACGKFPIVSNQVRYNLIDRTIEKDLLEYCQASHVTVIAYTPLARGIGRIRDCDPNGIIDGLARQTGRSPTQIALNWCLRKDGVVVIPGSNSGKHILDNCAASDWRLTPDQVRLLDENIQYRQRGRFDVMVRRYMPSSFQRIAVRVVNWMPRSLRRRLT